MRLLLLALLAVPVALGEEAKTCSSKGDHYREEESCETREAKCMPFDPGASSVIIRESGGRLGNQLFCIMMLLSLRLQFGYQPFLGTKTAEVLGPYFGDLGGMRSADDALCGFREAYKEFR